MKKPWLKRGAVAFAFLATLIVLLYVEEDWRGARELARVKKELEAKGEPLDPKALIPPPIPDEINVAAAPIFAELYEKEGPETRLYALREFFAHRNGIKAPLLNARTFAPLDCAALMKWMTGIDSPAATPADVLAALEKYRPLTDEMAAALSRPGIRWPITSPDNPIAEKLPYITNALNAVRFLSLRAAAEIETGRGEEALQDILFSFRMADVARSWGVLINYLVAVSCDTINFVPLTEGLQRHVWDDGQLRRLEAALAERKPCADYVRSIRQERLGSMRVFEFFRSQQVNVMNLGASLTDQKPSGQERAMEAFVFLRPRGWLKSDESYALDWLQHGMIDPIDADRGLVDATMADEVAHQKLIDQGSFWMKMKCPLSLLLISALPTSIQKAAYTQARVGELRIACAVERCRLEEGRIPDALDSLVPRYLPALPIDPIGGAPYVYRQQVDSYLIYSIGWNRRDDGGVVAENPQTHKERQTEGDWTWASRPDLYKFTSAKAP